MKLITVVSLSIFLSSCATMSPKECKVADWKDKGYQDAISGYSSSQLGKHRDACAKVKVKPNKGLYMAGYKKGEKEYCTYDNGIDAGENNKSVSKICNTNSRTKEFHKGYKIGNKRYKKQQEIKAKNRELENLDKKAKKIKEGKVKGGVKEIDLIYREKELIHKEIVSLEKELANIK